MTLKSKVLSIALIFGLSKILSAQVTPRQIPCFELTNSNKSEWENKTFESFCSETEGNLTMNYNVDGGIIANDKITLNAGATVSSSGGNFTAEILQNNDISDVAWFQPNNTPGIVKQYEKLELGIDLSDYVEEQISTGNLNPYSEDDIDLKAIFYRPKPYSYTYYHTTDSYTQSAFYYKYAERNSDESGWDVADTEHDWRVRFAPDEIGTWTVVIFLYVNGVLTSEVKKIDFDCVESNKKGPVVISRDNPRFFNYRDSDETYFPVGHNLSFGNYESRDSVMIVGKWLDELIQSGGNLTNFWIAPWAWYPEWEKLGDYSNNHDVMSELDRLIEKCETHNVYFNLTLLSHKRFLYNDSQWFDWTQNPYRNELGLVKPIEFFTDETAKKYFKQRIRYIIARWGYSPNLAYYEIATEVDGVMGHAKQTEYPDPDDKVNDFYSDQNVRDVFKDWLIEMDAYIKSLKVNNRNYSNISYTSDINEKKDYDFESYSAFDVVDIVSIHAYKGEKYSNYIERFDSHSDALKKFKDKPLIQDEAGHTFPVVNLCTPMNYHNIIWSTSFMGGAGSSHHWYWIEIHPSGHYDEVAGVSKFFANETQLHKYKYMPGRWHDGSNSPLETARARHNSASIEVFTLTRDDKNKVLGWVHNNSYWWGNLYDTNPCIKQLIDDCPKRYDNSPDSICGYRFIQGALEPLTGAVGGEPRPEMKIQGLWPGVKYRIEWYYTNTTGAKAGWEQEDIANLAGTAKFVVPPTDDAHADWAFKIYQTFRKSGELSSGEDNAVETDITFEHIAITPNPTEDKILEIHTPDKDADYFQIIDVYGRLIDKVSLNKNTINTYKLPESITPGVYYLFLYKDEKVIYRQKQLVK